MNLYKNFQFHCIVSFLQSPLCTGLVHASNECTVLYKCNTGLLNIVPFAKVGNCLFKHSFLY
jgi:hypothetical protein